MKTTSTFSIVCVLALAGLLSAQSRDSSAPAKGSAGKQEANKPQPMNVSPEREAAVRTFVERNHAELSDLLAHLKSNQPKEYERAVRELHRVTERLALIQERDPLHYELEVKLWTAQSRVQLLTAKLKMGATDDLKSELRQAIGVHADARLAVLKHEREKATQRLSKMDSEIARFEQEREKVIERQLETLVKTAQSGAKTKLNKPGKAAGNRAGNTVNVKPDETKPRTKPTP